MHFFVTGGAGFIGSTFVDNALERGHDVTVFDNFSTGQDFFLAGARKNPRCRVVKGDIRELDEVSAAMAQSRCDWVLHLAANADVRFGTDAPRRDLDYNTIGTWNVVESARRAGCKQVIFSSTGSVYGEPKVFPTPENAPFPEQTSLYGASKLAGEGLLSAYAHGFDMLSVVFRFVSILGPRYTHGHVFDFIRQLRQHPNHLDVLGDGNQNKSYLHVKDLMRGLWTVIDKLQGERGFHVFNIGHSDTLRVKESIGYITERMKLKPELRFKGGERGWIGDSPRIELDTAKLQKLGWKPQHSLASSVQDTVDYLVENSQLMDERT